METYWVGSYQYGITNYNGAYCVVDIDTYEYVDTIANAIEFMGSYEACCKFREKQITDYAESLY